MNRLLTHLMGLSTAVASVVAVFAWFKDPSQTTYLFACLLALIVSELCSIEIAILDLRKQR